MADKIPWYGAGLCFACRQCGSCCTGEPGYVWVSEEEIAALAAALGFPIYQFEASFVRRVGDRKSLIELTGGDCVFFDSTARRCRVYELRPRQCRTWPFWQSNVRDAESWRETSALCPGCNRGPSVPAEEIRRRVDIFRL